MIRITDMTISCLEEYEPSKEQLCSLFELLLATGVERVELPAHAYELIRPVKRERITLRLENPDEAALYPGISRFVCRRTGVQPNESVFTEMQLNDRKEINFLSRLGEARSLRVVGLDDLLCHEYETAFQNLRKQVGGRLEFCPENDYSCATAAAVEWVISGGTDIVTTFGGIGGKAALEEVLLALRVIRRYKPGASFSVFPRIVALMEEILSVRYPEKKPVIGRGVFEVESGIHIDGILKKPEMYEPFLPELVGSRRRVVVGKHSGRRAIQTKLRELGLDPDHYDSAGLLREVRTSSTSRMSSLSDEDFFLLAQKNRVGGGN